MDGSEEIGREPAAPDGYLQPKKFRLRLRCLRCGHEYRSKPFVAVPKLDPPCPREACRIEREVERRLADRERIERMLEETSSPGAGRPQSRRRRRRPGCRAGHEGLQAHRPERQHAYRRYRRAEAPAGAAARCRQLLYRAGGGAQARRAQAVAARVATLAPRVLNARGPLPSANIASIQAASGRAGESALVARPTGEPHMFNFRPRSG